MRQSKEMLGKRTAAGNQSEHPHGLTLDLGAGAVRLSKTLVTCDGTCESI